MVRNVVRSGLAGVLRWSGADRLLGHMVCGNVPLVLSYHSVVEDIAMHQGYAIPENLISQRMLERQLDWLGCRYRFISLDELGARLEQGQPFDKPVVAITFDDGYSSVYHHAFPLLKRKGIPAGLFVVTDLIGTARLQIYDKLYLLLTRAFSRWSSPARALADLLLQLEVQLPEGTALRRCVRDPFTSMRTLFTTLPQSQVRLAINALDAEDKIDESALTGLHALTWDMISEMHGAGMTIGSHTSSHALLTIETRQTVLEETAGSRRRLEQRLHVPIRHFAYPDGRFDEATVSVLAEAGYRFGYTTCLHRHPDYPLLTIPRKFMWEHSCTHALGGFSPSIMSCQAHRAFEMLTGCDQNHDGRLASPVSFPLDPQIAGN